MQYMDSGIFDPFEIIVGTYEQYLLGYKVHNVVNVSELHHTPQVTYAVEVTRPDVVDTIQNARKN